MTLGRLHCVGIRLVLALPLVYRPPGNNDLSNIHDARWSMRVRLKLGKRNEFKVRELLESDEGRALDVS